MDYLILGIACILIIAILIGISKYLKSQNQSSKTSKNKIMKPVKCPICQSNLFVGENIISKVYRPMNVPDQLCTISGCPHCFPTCEPNVRRFCPVCKKELSQKDTLTARLFNKNLEKKHVHILGCSNCHKPRCK